MCQNGANRIGLMMLRVKTGVISLDSHNMVGLGLGLVVRRPPLMFYEIIIGATNMF